MPEVKTPATTISKICSDDTSSPTSFRSLVCLSLCFLLLFGLFLAHQLERVDLNLAVSQEREKALLDTSLLASRIEQSVNSTFYLIVGLARLIEVNGGITDEQFREICSELLRAKPGLVNIAAAPDMVIQHVWPLDGNEAVLGLDYAELPQQRDAAFRVKATGEPIIAGPVSLVQGGEALIGRFPVHVKDPKTEERRFWGLISTPFKTSALYQEVGLFDTAFNLKISLRGRDALGAEGEVFFGPKTLDAEHPVYFPARVLSGSWQIAAVPKGGWPQSAPNAFYIRSAVAAFTILLGLIIWLSYLYSLRKYHIQEAERTALQVKQRFYANMSHELRTPLNGICGLSQIIEMSTPDEEIRSHANTILKSGETLTQLLDDVLVLSREDDGEVSLHSIELEHFLAELLPPLWQEAERKKLHFIQEPLPASCKHIRCHQAMLRQILWNLLSNAIKFTKSGSVTLAISATPAGKVAYHISDTGIGIAPDKLETVFQDFFQEDNSNTREFGGAGLGLAVVRRFVVRLGGSVRVESNLGVGTRFTVLLPNPR